MMFSDLKPHLVELRKRLAISVGAIILFFFVVFAFFWQPILDWMTFPLKEVLTAENSHMIFTKVQEKFFTALKVSFFTGFMVALPVIFYQLWLFIAPGLYDNEKKMVIPFVSGATAMFVIGAAFCYYAVIPFGFEFLINFGGNEQFTAMPSIGEYVGFFTKLLFGFGLAFEMPVITFVLAVLGLVTDKTLKEFFRYALVIIFMASALLTPPDILTQFLMAGPMIILYGISILIAKKINPDKRVDTEEEDA